MGEAFGRAVNDTALAIANGGKMSVVWVGERGMAMFSGLTVENSPADGFYLVQATGTIVPAIGDPLDRARIGARCRARGLEAPKVGEALAAVELDRETLEWAEDRGYAGELALRWYWDGATALGNYATLPLEHEGATMTGEWVISVALWRAIRWIMGRGHVSLLISTPAFACADREWFHAAGPRGFAHVRR